ncbi:NepR family anti-sigma factor [Methylobacterium sp.]|uniref:NepR family anti-sigma factor n=1 Tax=Methylobacterium sp. TaxID=409 RepID=UPI0025F41400|nr:NepR family anti-sigma factor [Methylobacterium sp.]
MTKVRPKLSLVPVDETPVPAAAKPMPEEARRRIGRNLRMLYSEILTEPLPERFETLLADLSARGETSQ